MSNIEICLMGVFFSWIIISTNKYKVNRSETTATRITQNIKNPKDSFFLIVEHLTQTLVQINKAIRLHCFCKCTLRVLCACPYKQTSHVSFTDWLRYEKVLNFPLRQQITSKKLMDLFLVLKAFWNFTVWKQKRKNFLPKSWQQKKKIAKKFF